MNTKNISGYLSVLAGVILFSSIEVVSKSFSGDFPALPLVFLRFFIGGILLLGTSVFILGKKSEPICPADVGKIAAFGLIGVMISMSVFHLSLHYIRASNAATIFCTNPIFSVFLAGLFLKERTDRNRIIGVILGFAGAGAISFTGSELNPAELTGSLLMLLAAITFSVYTTFSKGINLRLGTARAVGLIFVTGSLMLLPVIYWKGDARFITDWNGNAPQILYLSLACTGLGYLLFLGGLTRVDITRGISLFYLKPVIASFLAFFFLREPLTLRLFGGIAFVSAGLYFTLRRKKARPEAVVD